jgi:hypothetical protein
MHSQTDYFSILPEEIIFLILNKLDSPHDLGRISRVCRRFHANVLLLTNAFWRGLYAKTWLLYEEELALVGNNDVSWRDRFKKRLLQEKNLMRSSFEADTIENLTKALLVDSNPQVLLQTLDQLEQKFVLDQNWSLFDSLGGTNILVTLLGKFKTNSDIVTAIFLCLRKGATTKIFHCFGLYKHLITILDEAIDPQIQEKTSYLMWTLVSEVDEVRHKLPALNAIPILVRVTQKASDPIIKENCIAVLTWFAQNKNYWEQFKQCSLTDVLIDIIKTNDSQYPNLRDVAIRVLYGIAEYDSEKIVTSGLVATLLEMIRSPYLSSHFKNPPLILLSILCYNEKARKVIQSSNIYPLMFQILEHKKNGMLYENALGLIHTTIGFEGSGAQIKEFHSLNGIDRIVKFLDHPNAKVISEALMIVHSCINTQIYDPVDSDTFKSIVEKIRPHFDLMLQLMGHEDKFLKQKAIGFWLSVTCIKLPERQLNVRLIARVLELLNKESRHRMKVRFSSLLANLCETDHEAFKESDVIQLVPLWTEIFASERTQKLKNKPEWVTHIMPCPTLQHRKLQEIVVNDQRVVSILKEFATQRHDDVNRFRAVLSLSYLYQTGKLDDSVLQYFEQFTKEVPVNVKSRLIFSRTIPYQHLFNANKIELLVLGSWVLAQLSLTELGRNAIRTELDPKIVEKIESLPHNGIQYFMQEFRKQMSIDLKTNLKKLS